MTIVWDFGGVLFNWRPAELIKRALPARAADGAEAARWASLFFEGYGGDWGAFDRGTVEVPALVRRIVARTGLAEHEVQAVVDGVPAELQPIAESVSLLGQLREAGVRQCYLSNMPAPYADHLLASHRFIDWFEDGVFSSREKLAKPEPAIFELAAERFGVPASELLFFDDHPPNVAAARAAGWRAELFTDAAAAEAVLRAAGLAG